MRMPEVVETNAWYLSLGRDRIERTVEVVRVEQLAITCAEHEVVVMPDWPECEAPFELLGAVRFQHGHGFRREFDGAASGGRLGLLYDWLVLVDHHGLTHLKFPCIQVEILPPHAKPCTSTPSAG